MPTRDMALAFQHIAQIYRYLFVRTSALNMDNTLPLRGRRVFVAGLIYRVSPDGKNKRKKSGHRQRWAIEIFLALLEGDFYSSSTFFFRELALLSMI